MHLLPYSYRDEASSGVEGRPVDCCFAGQRLTYMPSIQRAFAPTA
jgi:hypothetical protein